MQQLINEVLLDDETNSTQYDDNCDDNEEDHIYERDGNSGSEQELDDIDIIQKNELIGIGREHTQV